jgi:ABC-2 type transport system ATP-binding protein
MPDHPGRSIAAAPAIETTALTKRYGHRIVVDRLDMRVPAGVVAGFIGPNGAGKTTTLRMLLALVKPTSGTGCIFGTPLTAPTRYLADVGSLVEGPGFHPGLSGHRNLAVIARLAGIDDGPIPQLLRRVGLADRGDDLYRAYSLGMKQRLGIAAALLGDPRLLILDEPANGLDPSGIREMRTMLRSFNDDGQTVFVSSHQLKEVQQVCDWLVMIDHGRLLYQGPTANLVTAGGALVVRSEHAADTAKLHTLLTDQGLSAARNGDQVRIELSSLLGDAATDSDPDATRRAIADVNRVAATHGITLVELTVVEAELEDRYEMLMTRGVR